MRVLFTGATGVIGQRAIPLLIERGHKITAVVRSDRDATWLDDLGATAAVHDILNPSSAAEAVRGHDAVFHFATSIPDATDMTKRKAWATNDRLRTEAAEYLVDAAIAEGVEAFVQESVTFFYADGGDTWLDESSAIDPPWEVTESALMAERQVARFTAAGGRGISLRISQLYGPGEVSADQISLLKARRLPVVGRGNNFVSHVHVDDVATALVAAVDVPSGVYNVTDDRPVSARESADLLAEAVGAPRARRVPAWLARVAVGKAANLLAVSQRVSNRAFREAAGWEPIYPSVREGWGPQAFDVNRRKS